MSLPDRKTVNAAIILNKDAPELGINKILETTAKQMWINPERLVTTFWQVVDAVLANEKEVSAAELQMQLREAAARRAQATIVNYDLPEDILGRSR